MGHHQLTTPIKIQTIYMALHPMHLTIFLVLHHTSKLIIDSSRKKLVDTYVISCCDVLRREVAPPRDLRGSASPRRRCRCCNVIAIPCGMALGWLCDVLRTAATLVKSFIVLLRMGKHTSQDKRQTV